MELAGFRMANSGAYSHTPENCLAFVRKLNAAGIACEEDGIMPIGATISTHIGPGAFGLVFVEKA